MSEVRVYGIRHHGPGSARSLLRALEEWSPDAVLIEGPPEGEAIVHAVGRSDLVPPVAMLVYDPENPADATFFPLSEFSPEWIAMRYAQERDVPVRLIDLVLDEEDEGPSDPLADLALEAGYGDPERLWDALVERREAPFEAIAELMGEIRKSVDVPHSCLAREATMRLGIRQARKDGFARIAVVCGAFHAPALMEERPAIHDRAQAGAVRRSKRLATWAPWSFDRLGLGSGYRAGVVSPAYYDLLWRVAPGEVASEWLLRAARLLREEDLDASPASVIEAVRLAETLSAMRGHGTPGLEELREAAWSVLCGGNHVPMRLVERRLVVGDRLGSVPSNTSQAPLQADLAAHQRRLRLKSEALERLLDLDLRGETDLERSRLLHRLLLIGVPWGEPQVMGRKSGTFHEAWRLAWRPEFAIDLIQASRWGGTVEGAATALAVDRARSTEDLAELGSLANRALLADLGAAVGPIMRRLENAAAVANDVAALMEALPPLAGILRYGNVRQTDVSMAAHVFDTVFARACIGLPQACSSLDDDAAEAMCVRIDATQSVVTLLADRDRHELWSEALRQVADLMGGHGMVVGRATRHLLDSGQIATSEVGDRLARLVSPGVAAPTMARWVEGFLAGSGSILIHDERLWTLVDAWVADLPRESFDDLLPLLRRTFSTFPRPERRQLGERVAGASSSASLDREIDEARAAKVVPIVRQLLGLKEEA